MTRLRLLQVFAVPALILSANTVRAQAQEPNDVKVELRPVGGSNRFFVGEEIRLQVEFSSSTTGRYLEPCAMFFNSHFGFPQCRFFNGWKFEISPADGWVDLAKEFPTSGIYGGPSFEIPSHDLTTEVVKIPFVLTQFYRFDKPGVYKVRLMTKVGLDDASTQRTSSSAGTQKPGTS